MHEKYPVLSGVSGLARIVGWVFLLIGGLIVLFGIVRLLTDQNQLYQGALSFQALSIIGTGVSQVFFSLLLIIIGGAVKVFIDIEHNTSRLIADSPPSTPVDTINSSTLMTGEPALYYAVGQRVVHSHWGKGEVTKSFKPSALSRVRFDNGNIEEVENTSLLPIQG